MWFPQCLLLLTRQYTLLFVRYRSRTRCLVIIVTSVIATIIVITTPMLGIIQGVYGEISEFISCIFLFVQYSIPISVDNHIERKEQEWKGIEVRFT